MELRLAGGSDEIPNFSPVHYPTPDQRSQAILPLSGLDGLPKVKEVYTLEQQALSKHCLSASIVYIQKNRSASLPGERCAIDCNWSSSQPATAWRSLFKLRLETLLRLDTS